jgi:predicted metal-dependent hydrolase
VQLGLPFLRADPPAPRVEFARMRRARRYIIRVCPDGSFRVTIPRGGSRREAEAFLEQHRRWAERERTRVLAAHAPAQWIEGDEILLRGRPEPLRLETIAGVPWLAVGGERARFRGDAGNLRPAAEECLRELARREVVPRLMELAAAHGLEVARVTVRNQRSRWGSCSRGGVIALNFRLVQAPETVRDYVLVHELMHLKQPNHSRRFWRLVEAACPSFRDAERWLHTEGRSLF